MSAFLRLLGIKAIGGGVDFNAFMFGVKYDDDPGVIDDDPEGAALFFFLGPFWVLFVL